MANRELKSNRLFIYRPLYGADIAKLTRVQAALSSVLPDFKPQGRLHQTLLHSNYTRSIRSMDYSRIVNPLPSSGREPLRLASAGMHIYPSYSKMQASYSLALVDLDNRFHDEHTKFQKRVAAITKKMPLISDPHITLGEIAPELATSRSLKGILDLLPEEISFKPIVAVSNDHKNLIKAPKDFGLRVDSDLGATTVEEYVGRAIPRIFLDSLRPQPPAS